MKKIFFGIICSILIIFSQAQVKMGQVITDHIDAVALKNTAGENATRRITIYLPPGYTTSQEHYPVIYYLHGFGWSDSLLIANDHINLLFDKAIATGKIRPMIVVMPDEYNLYRGSFYTNSTYTGNWADFTAKELVAHIDQYYRTIADKDSRGIAGHSMGGHGALKIAMLFPDVFSAVYGLSPALLALENEFGAGGFPYKDAAAIRNREMLVTGWDHLPANVTIALGRAYSPDPANPPFYTNLPYTFRGDSILVNDSILSLWKKNTPLYMIDDYVSNLRKLKAIKFDWGRNDEFLHIPVSCKKFSRELESLSINHYAEEYIGTHGNKIGTDDGRMLNEMFPFFDTYLQFESPARSLRKKSKKLLPH